MLGDPGVHFGNAAIETVTVLDPEMLSPVTLTVWFPATWGFPLDEVALPT